MEQVASLTAHLRPSPRWHDEVQTYIYSSRKSRRRSRLQTAHAGTCFEIMLFPLDWVSHKLSHA